MNKQLKQLISELTTLEHMTTEISRYITIKNELVTLSRTVELMSDLFLCEILIERCTGKINFHNIEE